MKTIKSVSILESSSGERMFVNQAGVNKPTVSEEKPSSMLGSYIPRGQRLDYDEKTKNFVANEEASAVAKAIETAAPGEEESIAGAPGNSVVSEVVSTNSLLDVMAGILPRHNPRKPSIMVCDIYRDMVAHDSTSGSAIELYATLPFSDFSLAGVKDEKMASTFMSSIEALNCTSLFPNIATEYNALGASILSTKWDEGAGKYLGIMPLRYDYCEFTQVPVFGVDPLINFTIPPEMLLGFNNEEVRKRYREFIPNDLLELMEGKGENRSGKTLNPDDTIFIPRKVALKNYSGTSMLQRAVPAWLYEKALIRGTIDQVYKRQRPIAHITVEHSEDWSPTQQEMDAIAAAFINADLDPLGANVVTRSGVNYNDVKRGDDFWKWNDVYDALEKIKLRGLGISESFISADVSFSTMEQALSVFMESVRQFRDYITNELFYQKIFPRISSANGFTRKKYSNLTREVASATNSLITYDNRNQLLVNVGMSRTFKGSETSAFNASINPADFVIPKVMWRKRLMPEADSDYLGVLDTLEQHNVPVHIRHWITAGGQTVESMLDGLDEDLKIREKIYEYKQQLAELEKEFGVQQENQEGAGEEGSEEFANMLISHKLGMPNIRRRGILARTTNNQGSEESELPNLDSNGKRRVSTRVGRGLRINRYNKTVAAAASEIARRENDRAKRDYDAIDKPTKTYFGGTKHE